MKKGVYGLFKLLNISYKLKMKIGIEKLDKIINIESPRLVLIGGRPGMMKSTFGLNIVNNISRQNISIGIFNLETSKEEISKKLDNVNNLFINDKPAMSINDICNEIKRLKENNNIKFVLIDYLQLISNDGKDILKELSDLSKDLNITICVISQLTREPEERQNHRPVLSDFGKNTNIEYADIVILLYVDDKNTTDEENLEIIVAKNDNGTNYTIE